MPGFASVPLNVPVEWSTHVSKCETSMRPLRLECVKDQLTMLHKVRDFQTKVPIRGR